MKRYVLLLIVLLCCIMPKAQSVSYSCRYWFDQNHEQAVTAFFNDSTWQAEIDVGLLSEGFHKFHLQIADTAMKWSSPQTYLFFKTADTLQDLTCHYWFDQSHAQMQNLTLGNGYLLLDVSDLENGLHTVNVLLEGDALTTTTCYMFMKVPVGNPSTEYQYHCWFDNDLQTMQTGWLELGCFQLEVDELAIGVHTVSVQLDDNGTLSAPQHYMFYKRPFGGCITKWEYWLNGDYSSKHTTDLSPYVDTLDIITLLPVEPLPIRSTCFHFQPNGEEPYINAKNEITFRFWDVGKHFIDKSTFYIDVNVVEPIVADTLERNTTVSIDAPRDSQMRWFKLDAGRGDYLSFQADKACTMQLFAPSGEEVYAASGPESIVLEGFNVWEGGTYYLAVHDVTGSGEMVSITYNWIYRYTISDYNVHLVGNGGCSTITFQGNGFNSLLDVYLVNYQNDTIRQLDIGHESNTTTTISFNFYQENLGVYDAVFEFFEETIRINGALEVQEPVDILLTTTVSYPSAFLINTPCTYTYTITNNGNMSAYAVPIFVYIASHTLDGISHIKFEGLNLPSLVDDMNLDSLSPSQIAELKEWEEELGDDHFFSFFQMLDEETGDTIITRTNFFFISLAPFETKTLSIKITANEPINVWMTIPNETIQPLVFVQNRLNYNQFCCTLDKVECWLRVKSDQLNIVSLVADAIALVGLVFNLAGPEGMAISAVLLAIAGYTTVASCFVTILSELTQKFSDIVCPEESDGWIDKILKATKGNVVSGWKILCGCIPMHELFKIADPRTVKMSLRFLKKAFIKQMAGLGTDGLAMLPISDINCLEEFHHKRPNCPPGDPKGGEGTPVYSLDPNDIYGYLSESGSHYMRQEIQNVHYEIEFENDTTLATAAAHTIIVCDTLDATKFDLNSLAARSVTIGDKRLDLNGEQTFARTLDLRPDIYVIAQVEQDYDPATGIIQWMIQSLDPMTMEPTNDPNQGVLPVNYYGNGVGFIDYSINLKQAFDDGTEISNRAGIIFDQNEVIMTPVWTNIVDAVKPVSQIESVETVNDSLLFNFVSLDNRSGVWYHTLYHRNDSTEMEWQVKKARIFGNEFMLQPELLTTEYLVMAVDSAGNHEEKEMVAEYIYYYDGPSATTQANALAQGWNWWSTYIEQNGINGMEMLQSSLGHNGLTIKSQNGFTDNFYQDMGYDYWYGSLESITNEQGYLINVTENGNASLTGMVANPANHPITIQPNWNWIGYPVAMPQAVTSALAGFSPMADDVVKGQADFTSYYEGFGWYPDDFMLMPGQSYLYFSNANVNKTLTYAGGGRGGVLKTGKAEKPFWKNDVHAFADNLNVMAVVSIDNEEQRDENLELGAFVNGECRGSARLRHFAPQDRYIAMLTVSGKEGELVEFRLVHTESHEMNEVCANHLVFSKNAIVGSLGKPYAIRFGDDVEVTGNMTLYPNPVESGKAFSLNVPQGETITEVVISDVLGNQLRHETGAVNPKAVIGLPTAGVYVIKAVAKSGNTYYGRLIVE